MVLGSHYPEDRRRRRKTERVGGRKVFVCRVKSSTYLGFWRDILVRWILDSFKNPRFLNLKFKLKFLNLNLKILDSFY